MKKYLLLLLMIFPFSAFAIEGTCAWHGGVNCSVGPDWDGSAICVDGWAESNEMYFEQKICADAPICTQYMLNQMSNTSEMNNDKSKYNELINLIKILNSEYPLIEIKIDEEYRGLGATKGGLLSIINNAKRENRNAVATSTYEAMILDGKLRKTQIKINATCIDEGKKAQEPIIKVYNSNIALKKQNNLDLSNNPYQNIREKKIYIDLRQRYAINTELGCSKLGLSEEELAMCNAFAEDENKDSWLSIDKPEVKVVTAQSLLEEKVKKETLQKEQKIISQDINKNPNTRPVTESKNVVKKIKPTLTENKMNSTNISTTTDTLNVISNNTSSTTEVKKETALKKISYWFKKLFK